MVIRELVTLLRFSSTGLREAEAGFSRLQGLARGLATAFASVGVAFSVKALAEAGDAQTKAMGQLGAVLEGVNATAAETYEKLYGISKVTGVDMKSGVDSFTQLQGAVKDMGGTAEQVIAVVQGMQQAGAIAGTSAEDTGRAMRQMGQALGKGKLDGDELGSIMENMAPLARSLAKELGVPVGQLKKMGEDGKLTSDKVFPALVRASASFGAQFARLPPLMSRSTGILRNIWTRFLADLDTNLGLSQVIARNLDRISTWLERLRSYTPNVGMLVAQFGGLEAILRPIGMGVAAAAAGFVALNSAMLLTALRLAAIPLAIAAIGLGIEDVYVWLNDGDSLLGRWLGPVAPVIAAAEAVWGLGGAIRLVQSVFSENSGMVTTTIREFQQLAAAAIAAGPTIAGAWTATQTYFAGVDATIAEGVTRFRTWCDEQEAKFGQVVTAIGNNFRTLGGEGTTFADDMARAATTVDNAWNGLQSMFRGLFDWWMRDWDEGMARFRPLWQRFRDALPQLPQNPGTNTPAPEYDAMGNRQGGGASPMSYNPGAGASPLLSPIAYGQQLAPRMGMDARRTTTVSAPITNTNNVHVAATGVSGAEVAAAAQSGVSRAMQASPLTGEGLARALGVAMPRVEAASA